MKKAAAVNPEALEQLSVQMDEETLTELECISMMESALTVEDWNALRDLVRRDFEFKHLPNEMRKLMTKIDGEGLIVKVLGKDAKQNTKKQNDDAELATAAISDDKNNLAA